MRVVDIYVCVIYVCVFFLMDGNYNFFSKIRIPKKNLMKQKTIKKNETETETGSENKKTLKIF